MVLAVRRGNAPVDLVSNSRAGAAARVVRAAARRRAVRLALVAGAVFLFGVLCGEQARAADGPPFAGGVVRGDAGASRPCPCWTASRRQGTGLRPGSRWGVRVASRTCGAPGPTPGPADSPRLGRARGLRRCGWRLRVVSRVRSWRRGPVRSLWLGLAPGLRRGAWWRSASASWLSRVPGLRSPRAGRLVVSGRCPAGRAASRRVRCAVRAEAGLAVSRRGGARSGRARGAARRSAGDASCR